MLQTFHPANASLLVNINGALVHRDRAAISPFDSAVQGGDAVWEGLRLYNGRIFKLNEHLDRLVSSARALAFAQIPTHEAITHEIRRTLEANGMRDNVHIRLTLTRGVKITSGMDPRLNQSGPTLIVLAEHKPPVYASAMSKGGLTLATSSVRRFPPDCLDPKIHHCNLIQSILAKIEATRAGADDAVMLDTRGFVAETNATHLFMVNRRVLGGASGGVPIDIVETPTCSACPEGITRATVLELCARHGIACRERDISLMEFYRADEVFCTGTMGELAWVSAIDGRPIGPLAAPALAAPSHAEPEAASGRAAAAPGSSSSVSGSAGCPQSAALGDCGLPNLRSCPPAAPGASSAASGSAGCPQSAALGDCGLPNPRSCPPAAPGCGPGPMTRRLSELFRDLTAREGVQVVPPGT